MKRRRFLLGTGLAVTASAAASSVGAFTAATLDRTASVRIVNDAHGLLALVPNDDLGSVSLDGGELHFSPDVNVDSIYQFGAFVEGGTDPSPPSFELVTAPEPSDPSGGSGLHSAFAIANNTPNPRALTCELTFRGDGNTETEVYFQFHRNGTQKGSLLTASGGGGTVTHTCDPGENVGVSFLVDALGVHRRENLAVTISIRANGST